MPTHIALLRGINVGGANRLQMSALRAAFEEAGCKEIRTYIASGNVVFDASAAIAKRVPELIGVAIRSNYGVDSPVIVRSARDFATLVRDNPFTGDEVDEGTLHVAFLADQPTKAAVAALEPDHSPGDEFVVSGREVYLRLPNGVARTKLNNEWLDTSLETVSTMRNWRTVNRLLEMAEGD